MSTEKRGAASPDAVEDDAVPLSAEEAEAIAAAAEADAAAARARANVLKVQQAAKAKQVTEAEAAAEAEPVAEVTTEASDDAAEITVGEAADHLIDEVDEVDGADEFEDTERRGGKLGAIAKYAAVILAVIATAAMASASAWIVVKHRQAEHQRDLDAQFSAAARQGVVSLMSLDFSRAKDDVQRIIDNSTGQFREDFQGQAEEFAKVAESSKVVTAANVTATAVQTMTEDTADVLVAAASTITNAQGAKEDPRNWRLIVSMARDGDQIKMAKVEFAP